MADSDAFLNFAKSLFGSSSQKIETISDLGDYVVVDSTCLSDISYDSTSKILQVTFRETGSNYSYFNVSEQEYETLAQASSVGKMYNGIIKYEHSYLRNF